MALQQVKSGPPQRDVQRGDLVRVGSVFGRVHRGSGGTANPAYADDPWVSLGTELRQVPLESVSICCSRCHLLLHEGPCPTVKP